MEIKPKRKGRIENLKPFKPGKEDNYRRGKGGKRKGAGAKPNWFKAKMAEIASRPASIQFLEDCVDGKPIDRTLVFGKVIKVPPPANVRLQAWAETADRGFGKPTPMLPMDALEGINLVALVRQAEEERGLDRTV